MLAGKIAFWWSRLRAQARKFRLGAFERWHHIVAVPPCYLLVDRLSPQSTVIDLGTGNDADFSVQLMDRYGLRSFGFDPTRKHGLGLEQLSRQTDGRFQILPYAISGKSGVRRFHESKLNVSGSFTTDHINVQRDPVVSYDVEVITLNQVFERLGLQRVDLLKMDIEGEEYAALATASDELLKQIDQLIVEFHHHCIDHVTIADNEAVIRRLRTLGFGVHTRDGVNYLFFQKWSGTVAGSSRGNNVPSGHPTTP